MIRYRKDQRVGVTVTINGRPYQRWIEPRLLLSDFIRDEAGLTGTHVGCEHGVCGACTVLIDGVPARSCLRFAVDATSSPITTIEGLANKPGYERVKEAFSQHHALQCGFCTAGIVASVWSQLAQSESEEPIDWDDLLAGHLCRCTGYVGIQLAVRDLQGEARES